VLLGALIKFIAHHLHEGRFLFEGVYYVEINNLLKNWTKTDPKS
jgi:hypothetical protein